MASISPETIEMIQHLLSNTFRQQYPQPDLSDDVLSFIRNHIMDYINQRQYNAFTTMYRSFHSNVEEDYRSHLILQTNGTILEMPSSWGSVMSDCRSFWMVFDRRIYQIETNLDANLCRLVTRRY